MNMPLDETIPKFTPEEYARFFELKKSGLELILGPMHAMVGHAIIAFQVGGPVDMYRFLQPSHGTAFATMELIEPDGTGPMPSRIGVFELIAFTKHAIDESDPHNGFSEAELRIRRIFTRVARSAFYEPFHPLDTCEVPQSDGQPNICVVFGEWRKRGTPFKIGANKFGLLLCIEVFQKEMEFAMQEGTKELIKRVKEKGYYPFSDLEREPVV